MLNWETLSKTADHEVLIAETPAGRWTVSQTRAQDEAQIRFMHHHPEGKGVGEIFQERRDHPERAEALSRYLRDQDVGIAGSLVEAKIVAETLAEAALADSFEAVIASSKMTARHSFTNDIGEFTIYEHPLHGQLQITAGPQYTSFTYETQGGSNYLLLLRDPINSEFGLDYPGAIKDYRPYAIRIGERIFAARKAAGPLRKALA